MVTKEQVQKIFDTAIEKHLPRYKFIKLYFNGRLKKVLGRAHLNVLNMSVEMSLSHMEKDTYEQVRDTVLHEIAHLVDFIRRGKSNHDSVWRAVAVEVGAAPRASKFLKNS